MINWAFFCEFKANVIFFRFSDAVGGHCQQKLRDAALPTLKERRERGDLIEVFKDLRRTGPNGRDRGFRLVDTEAKPLRSNTEVKNGEEVFFVHINI